MGLSLTASGEALVEAAEKNSDVIRRAFFVQALRIRTRGLEEAAEEDLSVARHLKFEQTRRL